MFRRTAIHLYACAAAALALAGCPGPTTSGGGSPAGGATPTAVPAAPATPAGGGTAPGRGVLTGRVRLQGAVPGPRVIQVTKDPEVCHAAAGEVQDVVVAPDGGLRDVVVEVHADAPEAGWSWSDPAEGYLITQKGCAFSPWLTVLHDGANLDVINDDPLLHNINTGAWNQAQPVQGHRFQKKIRYRGQSLVRLNCNIHSWMEGWLYVARTPLTARTGPDGGFRIEGVPAGEWKVTATHPVAGSAKADLAFAADGSLAHDFALGAR